jgi:hypothetical protein
MNRLRCFLTGGHRYVDTGISAKKCANPNWYTVTNQCIKCGKPIQIDLNVGKIIFDDFVARMKGSEK